MSGTNCSEERLLRQQWSNSTIILMKRDWWITRFMAAVTRVCGVLQPHPNLLCCPSHPSTKLDAREQKILRRTRGPVCILMGICLQEILCFPYLCFATQFVIWLFYLALVASSTYQLPTSLRRNSLLLWICTRAHESEKSRCEFKSKILANPLKLWFC